MACVLLSLMGCQPGEPIQTYEVAKETYGNSSAMGGGAATKPAAESKPARMLVALVEQGDRVWFIKLVGDESPVSERADVFRKFIESIEFEGGRPKWTLPERWLEKPGSGMRFATINVGQPGLDVSVISLPAPQEILANVNRWRKQLQLEDISQAELAENVEEIELGGAKATYVNIAGMMSSGGTGMGPFAGGAPSPGAAPFAGGGANGAPQPPTAPASKPAADPGITFTKPDSWTQGRMNSMRKAAFDVKTDDGQAEFTVSTLAAGGAALLPNVNRWRGQVGLAGTDEAGLAESLKDIDVGGIESKYVELVGAEKSTLAVIAIRDATAWFFKMMGDAETVAAEKENFELFVKSVQFSK